MGKRLEGKAIVVTGAGSVRGQDQAGGLGNGRAAAIAYAAEGARIVAVDINRESAEATRALAHFHKRWKGDHVVIDTWFAAQAQSPRAGTLNTVKVLTRDPLFHRTAPNKVRALIGTFAAGNPVQFNRLDGAGYAFVADEVLELDKLNPQVAARMVGAFRSWRSLESGRRTQARKALQRISKTKGLSSDVQEIVAKMIDA